MDLGKIIGALTGNDMIGEISKNINLDGSKIMSVIQAAIPKFLSAMQKNSSTAEGAASLTKALGSHAGKSFALDIDDGNKILSKVFGGDLNSVISSLGKQTGVNGSQISNILASIAPSLLSVLGNNNAAGNIGDLLGSLLGGSSNSTSGSGLGKMIGGLFGKLIKK